MLHASYNLSYDVGMLYGAFREPLCRVTTSAGSAEQSLPPLAAVSSRKKNITSSSFTNNDEVITPFWTLFTRLCAVGVGFVGHRREAARHPSNTTQQPCQCIGPLNMYVCETMASSDRRSAAVRRV